MRPLVIGENEKEALSKLKQNAESNIFSFDDLLDMKNEVTEIVGDRPDFFCYIPVGYRVVYSIEEHPLKEGGGFLKIRHASISVDKPKSLPSPEACELIIKELGYENGMENCQLSIENISETKAAVTILDKY